MYFVGEQRSNERDQWTMLEELVKYVISNKL